MKSVLTGITWASYDAGTVRMGVELVAICSLIPFALYCIFGFGLCVFKGYLVFRVLELAGLPRRRFHYVRMHIHILCRTLWLDLGLEDRFRPVSKPTYTIIA
jgi:hypothetical protein